MPAWTNFAVFEDAVWLLWLILVLFLKGMPIIKGLGWEISQNSEDKMSMQLRWAIVSNSHLVALKI